MKPGHNRITLSVTTKMLNLIIEDKLTEGWNVLCPLHQDEQLLLHTLSDVWDVGQSLCADVVICQLIANFIPVVALRSIGAESDNTCQQRLYFLPAVKTPLRSAKSSQRGHCDQSWCPRGWAFSC